MPGVRRCLLCLRPCRLDVGPGISAELGLQLSVLSQCCCPPSDSRGAGGEGRLILSMDSPQKSRWTGRPGPSTEGEEGL